MSKRSNTPPLSFGNHRRFVPLFHYVLVSLLVANLAFRTTMLFRDPSAATFFDWLVAISLGLLSWYTRIFPLGVQDRLIRLEERIRLERLLSPELRPRIDELRLRQFVALRFAADEEVEELVEAALAERLSGEAIKRRIRVWRADHVRI